MAVKNSRAAVVQIDFINIEYMVVIYVGYCYCLIVNKELVFEFSKSLFYFGIDNTLLS